MAYQETTRQSYGSKVKNSFQGILGGIALIIIGTIILGWNEKRAKGASDVLNDFEKNYVEMPNIDTVNPDFEGKAIHATGVAKTEEILRDADFGIAVNAFHLDRNVEYYQWEEESESESKDKLGGATETTTSYTYEPQWCSSPVNSNDFKDPEYKGKNFVWRFIEELDQQAANATFGAYRLNNRMIAAISGDEPVYPELDSTMIAALLKNVSDTTVVVTVQGNQVYIGPDPANPHIGDVKITFNQVTSPKSISILQKVVNGTFEEYTKKGSSFSRVEMGTISGENMIEHQRSANKTWRWIFRILGALLVIGGFRSLLSFISTVFAVIPFIQKIIGAGVGLVATLLGIVWSLVVIAIAWVAVRPVLGISLLVVAAALIVWLVTRSRKKKISDVAAVLFIGLMLCIGCTSNSNVGDSSTAAYAAVKGPVKQVLVSLYYGEGEPALTLYEYDESGNVTAEKELDAPDPGDQYCRIEELCTKDEEGRYTKEVWGFNGQPDHYNIFEYDECGRIVYSEYHQSDERYQSSFRNTYDENGNLLGNVSLSPYGEVAYQHELDDQGRAVRTVNTFNGKVTSITLNEYDENGNVVYSEENFLQENRKFQYYHSFAGEEPVGSTTVLSDEQGTRVTSRDSIFTDKAGLRHQRCYCNYDDGERSYEGTFNKQGMLTHYEYFEGSSNNPTYVVDYTYDSDGQTLSKVEWKDYVLGQLQGTRSETFSGKPDTFGNWTKKTLGSQWVMDGKYFSFDELLNNLPSVSRTITYRGDDQGHNYGFIGKAGQADIRLTFTEDNDVLFGDLTVDGNTWRAAGIRNDAGDLHVDALTELGDIPWTLDIPAGKGKREADLRQGDGLVKATVSPTRDGLQTYSFPVSPDDLVGIYQYRLPDGAGNGQLDVSRTGEEWEIFEFDIRNSGNASCVGMAHDQFQGYLGEETVFYQYLWNDEYQKNMTYCIRFYDGFAIIRIIKGNPADFFAPGTTIEGVYAKLPSVG